MSSGPLRFCEVHHRWNCERDKRVATRASAGYLPMARTAAIPPETVVIQLAGEPFPKRLREKPPRIRDANTSGCAAVATRSSVNDRKGRPRLSTHTAQGAP